MTSQIVDEFDARKEVELPVADQSRQVEGMALGHVLDAGGGSVRRSGTEQACYAAAR